MSECVWGGGGEAGTCAWLRGGGDMRKHTCDCHEHMAIESAAGMLERAGMMDIPAVLPPGSGFADGGWSGKGMMAELGTVRPLSPWDNVLSWAAALVCAQFPPPCCRCCSVG